MADEPVGSWFGQADQTLGDLIVGEVVKAGESLLDSGSGFGVAHGYGWREKERADDGAGSEELFGVLAQPAQV